MTPQEATNWCEQFTDNLVMINVDSKRKTLGLQAMQVCKSALEKQIPKKPKIKLDFAGLIQENKCECKYHYCPCCKQELIATINDRIVSGRKHKYCKHCGQALDWSDTE